MCRLHDGGNCEFINPDTCPDECYLYQELMEAYRERVNTFWEIMQVLDVNRGDEVIPTLKALLNERNEAVQRLLELEVYD